MTVFVTGATGHVGGNLVRALVERGRKVRAMVRKDTRAVDGLDVERAAGDVLDPASLDAAMEGADVVYHLAARITIEGDEGGEAERVNVLGTRNVVDACLRRGVRRLVHFSSIHAVYQEPMDRPLDEERPLADKEGCLAYDRTKSLGEREIAAGVARGLDAVIVNPTSILGPFDFKPSRMGQVVLDLATGRMPALVEGGFDWVDVRDVVRGALAAEEKGERGRRYLLGGHWLSMKDLALVIEAASGRRVPRLVFPLWVVGLAAPLVTAVDRARGRRPLVTSESIKVLKGNTRVCCDRAARELGYGARPIRETIEDTIAWFRGAKML